MRQDKIEELLENYGLERILEDNQLTLREALDILEELGFLNLEMYYDE